MIDIKVARLNVRKTLVVLESMKDGNHCGDIDEMISDLSTALKSLNEDRYIVPFLVC